MQEQALVITKEGTPHSFSAHTFLQCHEDDNFWLSDWLHSLTPTELYNLSKSAGESLGLDDDTFEEKAHDLITTAFIVYGGEFQTHIIATEDISRVHEFIEAISLSAALVMLEKQGVCEHSGKLSLFEVAEVQAKLATCDIPEGLYPVISLEYH